MKKKKIALHFKKQRQSLIVILLFVEFRIKNTGIGDLFIDNAKASCGCTVPEWPKKLLVPGEEGEIKVTFNSEHRIGEQKKNITLTTNATPSIKILTIEGMVLPSEN